MDEKCVGVMGAMSLLGDCLLRLLTTSGWQAVAFSRHKMICAEGATEWRQLTPSLGASSAPGDKKIGNWICVAPIWVLPQYFDYLQACGARRIVALSSTSRFTKNDSSDRTDQAVAQRLAEGEARLQAWAERNGIAWVILRPTLIYGRGRDKNVSEIVRFVRRFGFFPLVGAANGLRQPVHADDVASAAIAALETPVAANRAYNLSGGETLAYRDMVLRVFAAMGASPRLPMVPLGIFRMAIVCLRCLPRYRHWSAAMAERMNRDLVFDHADAARDLHFIPRPFRLAQEDLPA